jgi:hypothetical protein
LNSESHATPRNYSKIARIGAEMIFYDGFSLPPEFLKWGKELVQ